MSEVNHVFGHLYSEASENNTKSRKYFQAQIQSDQTLRARDYIVLEIKKLEL